MEPPRGPHTTVAATSATTRRAPSSNADGKPLTFVAPSAAAAVAASMEVVGVRALVAKGAGGRG